MTSLGRLDLCLRELLCGQIDDDLLAINLIGEHAHRVDFLTATIEIVASLLVPSEVHVHIEADMALGPGEVGGVAKGKARFRNHEGREVEVGQISVISPLLVVGVIGQRRGLRGN